MNIYYLNKLPDDVYNTLKKDIIIYLSALKIQNVAIKMFYKKYGKFWQNILDDYDSYLDYYCYLNNIQDPIMDYFNYYR